MSFLQLKSIAVGAMAALWLTAAFAIETGASTVAEQFIRAYFQDDNIAEAVKLSRGAAKETLEKELEQIRAVGAKEPAADKPAVTTQLVETQPVSPDESLYFFRVESSVQEVEPITAELTLRREDGSWHVSKFVQYDYTGRE
jgi:hypothetical protein